MEIKEILKDEKLENHIAGLYSAEEKETLRNNTLKLITDQNKENTSWLVEDFKKFVSPLLGLNITSVERENIPTDGDILVRLNVTCQDDNGNNFEYYIGYYGETVFATLFSWFFDYIDSLSNTTREDNSLLSIIPVQQDQLTSIFFLSQGLTNEERVELLQTLINWIYITLY